MHVKNPILFGLMAILLLAGTITPGISQSTVDTKVVINEVEINWKQEVLKAREYQITILNK